MSPIIYRWVSCQTISLSSWIVNSSCPRWNERWHGRHIMSKSVLSLLNGSLSAESFPHTVKTDQSSVVDWSVFLGYCSLCCRDTDLNWKESDHHDIWFQVQLITPLTKPNHTHQWWLWLDVRHIGSRADRPVNHSIFMVVLSYSGRHMASMTFLHLVSTKNLWLDTYNNRIE